MSKFGDFTVLPEYTLNSNCKFPFQIWLQTTTVTQNDIVGNWK